MNVNRQEIEYVILRKSQTRFREIHLNSAKSRSDQQNSSHRKLFRQKVTWKECTYNHLIYCVDYIVHFVPRDETVVVHVVQTKGPWKETKKGRETWLTSATERFLKNTKSPKVEGPSFGWGTLWFHARFSCEHVSSASSTISRPRHSRRSYTLHSLLLFRSLITDFSKRTIEELYFSFYGDLL